MPKIHIRCSKCGHRQTLDVTSEQIAESPDFKCGCPICGHSLTYIMPGLCREAIPDDLAEEQAEVEQFDP